MAPRQPTWRRRGWGRTYPNPMVGAVVVRHGEIVGSGCARGVRRPACRGGGARRCRRRGARRDAVRHAGAVRAHWQAAAVHRRDPRCRYCARRDRRARSRTRLRRAVRSVARGRRGGRGRTCSVLPRHGSNFRFLHRFKPRRAPVRRRQAGGVDGRHDRRRDGQVTVDLERARRANGCTGCARDSARSPSAAHGGGRRCATDGARCDCSRASRRCGWCSIAAGRVSPGSSDVRATPVRSALAIIVVARPCRRRIGDAIAAAGAQVLVADALAGRA